MKAINIKTEYLTNPIGIANENPRISWNIDSLNNQVAYRIFGSINNNLFDTGLIYSNQMYYDFNYELKEQDVVNFNIELLDDLNNLEISKEESFFEVGINDFKHAKYICGNYIVNKAKRYPIDYFKKEFKCKKIKKARLYSTSCGIYYAYINDSLVSNELFNPGFTNYHKRLKLSTFDITNLLNEGLNTIKFELGDGWYRGSIGAKGRTNTYGSITKLIAELEITYFDNTIDYIYTDKSFSWSNDGSIIQGDLKDGEIVDLNKTPSYKFTAKEVNKKYNLCNLNTNPVTEHEVFKFEKIIKHSNSKVYVFKQNLAGYFSIKCNKTSSNTIKVVMGEILDNDNHVSLKNIQCIRNGKKTPLQECIITLKEGINEYKPKYYFGGFKYIEIFGDIDLLELNQIAIYSNLKEISYFECSNELINKFYRNTLWSLKSNSIDIPTDCPTRERMGWTGDSQVFFNTASYLTDYKTFSRKHVVDIFDRQWKNGKTSQIVPFSNEDWYMNPMNGSVGWADACVLIPYRYYLINNDDRLLKKYFPNILKYAHFMISRCGNEKGIYSIYAKRFKLSKENNKYKVNTGQSYGEWAEPNDVKPFVWTDFCEPHPEESMAYTSYILSLIIKIEDIINDHTDYELIKEYSIGVKNAYQELVTLKEYTLDTNRQAKLVRPLYFNLLNDDQTKYAKKRLIEALEFYKYRLGTGFLSTPFILDVLKEYNIDACIKLLLNEDMPGWLYMAKFDTGTIWEGWEGPNSQSGIASLNHYSKGAMVEWLFKSLLGINILPNNNIIINPLFTDKIKYYKGEYDSIYGLIKVSIENNKIEIYIPGNVNAKYIYNKKDIKLNSGLNIIEEK